MELPIRFYGKVARFTDRELQVVTGALVRVIAAQVAWEINGKPEQIEVSAKGVSGEQVVRLGADIERILVQVVAAHNIVKVVPNLRELVLESLVRDFGVRQSQYVEAA